MRLAFVTLFPEIVEPYFRLGVLGRATASGLIRVATANPRNFAYDRHRTVDDHVYGGGPGMLMRPEPVALALASLGPSPDAAIVVTDPTGQRFDQVAARGLAQRHDVIFVCGHYEGIDQRFVDRYATHVYTVGDYVLTGGELPAMTMADAVGRLLPGVLGSPDSLAADSHVDGLLSAPAYTRPPDYEGLLVPEVLMSGDHLAIARWARREALHRTRAYRPDLFAVADLAPGDADLLSS